MNYQNNTWQFLLSIKPTKPDYKRLLSVNAARII